MKQPLSRVTGTLFLALTALLLFAPAVQAQRRGAFVGGHYGPRFYGGYARGWWPGWYGPGWYGPGWYGAGWWGPGYYAPANAGRVKLQTADKDASVYIDGGYAGLAHKLKKFSLRAGTHRIELRDEQGKTFFQQRVTVIPGRTLELHADRPA